MLQEEDVPFQDLENRGGQDHILQGIDTDICHGHTPDLQGEDTIDPGLDHWKRGSILDLDIDLQITTNIINLVQGGTGHLLQLLLTDPDVEISHLICIVQGLTEDINHDLQLVHLIILEGLLSNLSIHHIITITQPWIKLTVISQDNVV